MFVIIFVVGYRQSAPFKARYKVWHSYKNTTWS